MNAYFAYMLLLAAIPQHAMITGDDCTGAIHGIVRNQQGQPASGLQLTLYPLGVDFDYILPTTRTAADGSYQFEVVCPGTYTVVPSDEEAEYPYINPGIVQNLTDAVGIPSAALDAAHADAEFYIQLPPKPTVLIVHVQNSATKADIPAADVRIRLPGRMKSWSPEYFGRPETGPIFRITLPSDRDVLVRISAKGFHTGRIDGHGEKLIHLSPGTEMKMDVELEPKKG
jgi:hypothetical protein